MTDREAIDPAWSLTDSERAVADLLMTAWGIIANAGGGDWEKETQEWHAAAIRWRDRYHAYLDTLKVTS